MNTTVSVSDFRDNLVDYLALLGRDGESIIIKDARKNKPIVELAAVKKNKFDWKNYFTDFKKLAGGGLFIGDKANRISFRRSFNWRIGKTFNR